MQVFCLQDGEQGIGLATPKILDPTGTNHTFNEVELSISKLKFLILYSLHVWSKCLETPLVLIL